MTNDDLMDELDAALDTIANLSEKQRKRLASEKSTADLLAMNKHNTFKQKLKLLTINSNVYPCWVCGDAERYEDLFFSDGGNEVRCYECSAECYNRCGTKERERSEKEVKVLYYGNMDYISTIGAYMEPILRTFCETCYELEEGDCWKDIRK